MTPSTLLEQYQAILELEELGAWYLAKVLRKELIRQLTEQEKIK